MTRNQPPAPDQYVDPQAEVVARILRRQARLQAGFEDVASSLPRLARRARAVSWLLGAAALVTALVARRRPTMQRAGSKMLLALLPVALGWLRKLLARRAERRERSRAPEGLHGVE